MQRPERKQGRYTQLNISPLLTRGLLQISKPMKRCPTCDKTFDDNMRFCQADGTPLVDDVPVDPYKTMVATPADMAAMTGASSESEDVLDLPKDSDPARTMYASEDEIRAAMDEHDKVDDQVIDIPPLTEPERPKFSEPTPPPSPFSAPGDIGSMTTPPIPSPFEERKSTTYEPPTPAPSFAEPEPVREEPAFNPFDQPQSAPMAQGEWTPPPAPEASWQNQPVGQNTPFQPPPAGTTGLNQTLPIVSLVFGLVSLCCYISPLTGLVALITGYMGIKNVNNDPAHYGGKPLAIAGMIVGGVMFLVGAAYYIIVILAYAGLIAGSMFQNF